ncbi:hypothetical protein BO85DRAFT_444035 [Aspergillus piperis CBS 112811]|nr:hypothetical protein BO85DRAFT_444035 [Aspergillus piperis CBS 112811]RAH62688.1 hypothetical protein BO85DRAFT_444035 [Aspergillus piperis CBS 112811]
MNGGGRGGRGGPARTRGGYVAVDNDPEAGVLNHNPNFRPKNYSQVPPPQSISGRGRGRGNNMRGDRGTGFRGRGRGRGAAVAGEN